MSERIGTRELRADLAAQLRRAAAGQTVVITSAGAAIAALGPVGSIGGPAPAPSGSGGDRPGPSLDALVAAGLVVPPRRAAAPRLADPVPVWRGIRLDRALREVRG